MSYAETEHYIELQSGEEVAVTITWDVENQESSSYYGSQYVTEKWIESEPITAVLTFENGRIEHVGYSPKYEPKTEAQKILNDGLIDCTIDFDESLMKYDV
jgi:hypothetical protein